MKPSTAAIAALACTLAACGSSRRPPGNPAGEGTSHVTMEDREAKHEVSGPSFALLDTGRKVLVVYTFQPDTDPAPSCELLSNLGNMKRGGFLSFSVKDFDGAPGTYSVADAGAMLGDPDKGDMTMFSTGVTATSVAVRSYTDGAFSAEVTSTATERKLTGSVSGKICPSVETAKNDEEGLEPPALPEDKPPPIVPKLDTEGVGGLRIGMSAKKLPKGAKKKKRAPKQPATVTVYDAKGVLFMGQRISEASIVFERDALSVLKVSVPDCNDVVSKLEERYGEGGTAGLDGKVWRGKKTQLTVMPFEKECVVELGKLGSEL